MILGIGTDLVDIRRIAKSISHFGNHFLNRIFTSKEQDLLSQRRLQAASYAKNFAAKEATAKALGTGMRAGVSWQDIEILRNELGAPQVLLHGPSAERLQQLTPSGMVAKIHLALTDEWPYAQAFVMLSAIPEVIRKG
ncbi:MAG TPA: holo-ACP synthase [Candidatus Nitrosotenuis sp.]|jgi:holo-[acyl-carrier protein] synthase|nr:holo-ACP synthase [Candidatus Nitrosotenuis sp.]